MATCRKASRRVPRSGLLVACMAVGMLAVPATASAATSKFVTMLSESGDYIGQGQARMYDESNASITPSGDASYLTINVSGGTHGDSFNLTLAPPPGEKLRTGLYLNAQRAPFREATRPGIDFSGDGRGCNTIGGRFDVKDVLFDTAGKLVRLWVTYEQHCENGVAALFGEIRFGVQRRIADWVTAGGHIWWPDAELGRNGAVVPVWVINAGQDDLTMAAATLIGRNKGDWLIRSDECTGVLLAPQEACQVWVRFVPKVAGPRTAGLSLKDSLGRVQPVALDGAATSGLTAVNLQSDAGDYIGQGRTYAYTPANALITASGSRTGVFLSIDTSDGGWWNADFVPASGDILAVGDYPDAHRYPFHGTGPGFDFSGNGRGCNQLNASFSVKSIAFTSDGTLRHFGATFEQHCEGATPALRGDVSYRVPTGDVTAPGRVANLGVVRQNNLVRISWVNPPDPDYATTIVRYAYGDLAPAIANSGHLAFAGNGTTKTISVPRRPVAVSAFTVDSTGNASRPVTVLVPSP